MGESIELLLGVVYGFLSVFSSVFPITHRYGVDVWGFSFVSDSLQSV